MIKYLRSQTARVKKEFSLLSPRLEIERLTFYVLILLLPTEYGKHFWPYFSQVLGIRIDYLSPTLYVTDILVIALFLFWIRRQNFNKFFENIPFPWLVFFIYLLINTVLSNNPLLSLYGLTKILEMIFLGYYISRLDINKKTLSRIAFIAALALIIESVLSIAQYTHQGSINGLFYFLGERKFIASTPGIANASVNGELLLRPYGTFSHPNVLAGYLVCILVLIYSFLNVQNSLVKKILKYSALLLGSIALLLTLSRLAILLWLIMVIAVLLKKLKKQGIYDLRKIILFELVENTFDMLSASFSTRLNQPRSKNNWVSRSIILFIALATFGFVADSPIASRLLGTSLSEQAFTQRVELIKSTIIIIKSHPIFGVGLYNFIPSLSYVQKPISGLFYFQPVHNIFLLITAEAGITGLFFFLLFIFRTYQRLKKKHKPRSNILAIVLSMILILGLFDHYWLTLQQGQLLLAFVLGLCWSINKDLPSPPPNPPSLALRKDEDGGGIKGFIFCCLS